MADVFTLPKLYECCPNYLYLYQHYALKGMSEAIVEGMGGVWDRCARPERHISLEAGVQDSGGRGLLQCTQAIAVITRRRQRLFGTRTLPRSTSRLPPSISRTRRQSRHGAPSRAKSCRGS
jgi:hypothetical protein